MAELDPALQDEISNLQTRHTALVDAVRNYSGGSIAQATNDLLAAQAQTESTIDERETALLGLIQQQTATPVPSLLSHFSDRIFMLGARRLERGVSLDDIWLQFSRSSPAWEWGPNGHLVEYGVDAPAWAYDPITGSPLGLARRKESTNLIAHSDDFSESGWSQNNDASIALDGSLTDPYGNAGAWVADSTAGSSTSNISWSQSINENTDYTFSLLIRAVHPDDVGKDYMFNIRLGGESTNKTVTLTDSWERHSITFNSGSETGVLLRVLVGADLVAAVGCAQLNEGAVPGGIVPTSGSSATRSEDFIGRTPLGEPWNSAGATIYIDTLWQGAVDGINYILRDTNTERYAYILNGNVRSYFSDDFDQKSVNGGPLPSDGRIRYAVALSPGEMRASLNGGQVVSQSIVGRGMLTRDKIAMDGDQIVSSIHIYPRALDSDELEALTS